MFRYPQFFLAKISFHRQRGIRKYLFSSFLVTLFFVSITVLTGCDQETNVLEACEPLSIVDGNKTVKTKEGVTLILPAFADVRRRSDQGQGCEYISSLYFDFLWYEGKLISEAINRFKVPEGKRKVVKLYYRGSGHVEEARASFRNDPESADKKPWIFEGALPHKRFPLEYYPKFFWDDPKNPSEDALKRERLDSIWGIRNTKYKHVHSGFPFTAYCSIPPADKHNLSSRIESDFAKYGASMCRGSISVEKGGEYISAMIDVYAYLGSDQEGVKEINLIYDAAVEKLQSYIQE
ncbi:hypothetical protein imdm_1638 [gamma proteobacterium IMCC2047]|nr:hypothetical protein imdm_1638 [gamma proteobacterium IMCC2047]